MTSESRRNRSAPEQRSGREEDEENAAVASAAWRRTGQWVAVHVAGSIDSISCVSSLTVGASRRIEAITRFSLLQHYAAYFLFEPQQDEEGAVLRVSI